jgi:hypothetical protein
MAKPSSHSLLLATLIFAGLTRPLPLIAQERLAVGPFLGFFVSNFSFAGPIGNVVPGSENYRQQTAAVFGAEANLWLSPRLGIGAVFSWTPSDVRQEAISPDTSLPAAVLLMGGFLSLRLTPSRLTNDVRLRAGVASLKHMGAAFEPYGHPRSLTGLLGIDATLPLVSQLRVAGGLDMYLYSFQLTDSLGTQYQKRFMADLVARVGALWTYGHH